MGARQESASKIEIDARLNYWGSLSGPHHVTQNPNGAGDAVSDDVIFEMWMPGFPGYEVYMPILRNRMAGYQNVYMPLVSR